MGMYGIPPFFLGAGTTVPVAKACAHCTFVCKGAGSTLNRHCIMSCHNDVSTMINFGHLTLLCHHVCKILNNQLNHDVWELKSWNSSCSQHLEIKPATVRAKIRCFILVDEYLYHCWHVVPALLKVIPQVSIQDQLEFLLGVHEKLTTK